MFIGHASAYVEFADVLLLTCIFDNWFELFVPTDVTQIIVDFAIVYSFQQTPKAKNK